MPNKKSTIEIEPTVRIAEASRLLGVTPMTLRRWEISGLIKPLRIGKRGDRRYTKQQILKILDEGLK